MSGIGQGMGALDGVGGGSRLRVRDSFGGHPIITNASWRGCSLPWGVATRLFPNDWDFLLLLLLTSGVCWPGCVTYNNVYWSPLPVYLSSSDNSVAPSPRQSPTKVYTPLIAFYAASVTVSTAHAPISVNQRASLKLRIAGLEFFPSLVECESRTLRRRPSQAGTHLD